MKWFGKYQRGAAIPETAIVLPVALILVFGIIDFGRAMYTYAYVAQVAREAARWAMVRGSSCSLLDHCNASSSDVQTYVRGLSVGLTNSSNTLASAAWTCPHGYSGEAPGCSVTVSVTNNFAFILPNLPTATLPLTSTSTMVISQ